MFQILGRRADSLRIGHYTNFLDTTIAVKFPANIKRAITRAIVDNNKIKLRRNKPKLFNRISNTFLLVISRNGG